MVLSLSGRIRTHHHDGPRQGIVVVKTLVALTVQCTTTQLTEFRDVVYRGAIDDVPCGFTIPAEMHAAVKDRLVGGLEPLGIRLELRTYLWTSIGF